MQRALILLLSVVLFPSSFALIKVAGPPVLTIPQIQGPGATSPYAGQKLARPLRGCVTGVTADGFFLQDQNGDGDRRTSDGVYVYRYSTWKNPRGLKPGDLLELSSFKVTEFYGQTELTGLPSDKKESYRLLGQCPLPSAVPIAPEANPAVDPAEQYEMKEAMRVVVDLDASVVGPTQRFESRYPAGDPELTLVPVGSPFFGTRIFANQLPQDRGTVALSGGLGINLPEANVNDRVDARQLTGVLAYQFGRYVLLVDDPAPLKVQKAAHQFPTVQPARPDEWTACTFNAQNLFDAMDDRDGDTGDWIPASDAEYRSGLSRRGAQVRERLGACTVLAAQEIEGKDAVWADLAAAMGPNYRFDYRESEDARDITVGIIYDATRVEVTKSASAQACTGTDYGVAYDHARGSRVDPNLCVTGSYPLYDRPPYVADLLVTNASRDRRLEVRLIVVHLKSKRGDEAENAERRIHQARYVAELLESELKKAPEAIALGDFNDDLGSEPLEEFRSFVNLYARYAPLEDRYSYIYNGRAQAVDHIIMTAGMERYFVTGGAVHINADYAEPLSVTDGRTSDHDPVFVRFRFEPTGINSALVGAASGGIGTGYHHSLRLK